jgi:2-dehydro-3-deoxygluconokinase
MNNMKKIVTFGEIMMRLNPPGYLRLQQTRELEVSFAGGEANVAVAVANYGLPAMFVSKVPNNDLGQCAVNTLRQFGVDTTRIARGGSRLGIYFVEKGASQRASKVIYDRANSSIALASRSDFNWEEIMNGASWFHFTGITPALGGDHPEICLDACRTAKKLGITVSCDLNYRNKLWNRDAARETMSKLMPFVDLCIANEEDASDVFGIHADNTSITDGKLDRYSLP